MRHRVGVKGDTQNDTFTLPLKGGRSLHSDPCGKAVESARKPTFVLLGCTKETREVDGGPGCVRQYRSQRPIFTTEAYAATLPLICLNSEAPSSNQLWSH